MLDEICDEREVSDSVLADLVVSARGKSEADLTDAERIALAWLEGEAVDTRLQDGMLILRTRSRPVLTARLHL